MRVKNITVGNKYILLSTHASHKGCAEGMFKKFKYETITALKKLNNYKARNDVYIQGFDTEKNTIINFWCSAFDLDEIGGR